MSKVVTERDVKVFEKEMRQAQISEGLAKIDEIRKKQREDPNSIELEQEACGGKSLVMQQRQKARNRKLEEQFEAEFVIPQKPKLPPKAAEPVPVKPSLETITE